MDKINNMNDTIVGISDISGDIKKILNEVQQLQNDLKKKSEEALQGFVNQAQKAKEEFEANKSFVVVGL